MLCIILTVPHLMIIYYYNEDHTIIVYILDQAGEVLHSSEVLCTVMIITARTCQCPTAEMVASRGHCRQHELSQTLNSSNP